jgi:enoyl-CoA hydratase
VIILDAVGPIFSAGHDIAEEIPVGSPPGNQESWREFLEYLRYEWYTKWWDYTKPVICKVDAVAIAGGIEMCCFADAAYCSEESVFTYWPISTVSVAFSPSLILPWIIGMRKAKELMITKGFSGKEAESCNLVNKCLPRDQLEAYVMEQATTVSKIIPDTIRLGKFCFRFIFDRLGVRDAMVLGSEMDILAHCHTADREFQEIMREEGVKGIVSLAKERMEY